MFHHSRCMVHLAVRHDRLGKSDVQAESPKRKIHKSSGGVEVQNFLSTAAEMNESARQERSRYPYGTSALPLQIDAECCSLHVRKSGVPQTEYLALSNAPHRVPPSFRCSTSS